VSADVVRGTIESSEDRFEWRPPLSETAGRNRNLFRLAFLVGAALAALWAVESVRGSGAAAFAIAMLFPALVLFGGLGVDRIFAVGTRLRIVATPAGMRIADGRRQIDVPLATVSSIDVDDRPGPGRSPSAATWSIVVRRVDADPVRVVIPIGPTGVFVRSDAVALERELRRRCGVGVPENP
jgi:hypothetical protein